MTAILNRLDEGLRIRIPRSPCECGLWLYLYVRSSVDLQAGTALKTLVINKDNVRPVLFPLS